MNTNLNMNTYEYSVTFPKPYHDYCTNNILVEDYVSGVLMSDVITNLNKLEQNSKNPQRSINTTTTNNNTNNNNNNNITTTTNNTNAATNNNNTTSINHNTKNTSTANNKSSNTNDNSTTAITNTTNNTNNEDEEELIKWKHARKKLAKIGLDAILKMVFEDNFIHAG